MWLLASIWLVDEWTINNCYRKKGLCQLRRLSCAVLWDWGEWGWKKGEEWKTETPLIGKVSCPSAGKRAGQCGVRTLGLERWGTFLNQSQYPYGHSSSSGQTCLDVSKHNVCGRQAQTFKTVRASCSLYTFSLIKLSFGSQSYLIVLTQHINLKYIFQCPRSRMGEESVPQGNILLLTSEEVPLVPTVKGCLVKVLTLNLHPVLLQPW